jgi:dipeptidase
MAGDMAVALGDATANGQTLFAHSSHRPPQEMTTFQRVAGRAHELGEKVATQFIELPQARQTFTVLGSQPEGFWGYSHGVNEHGLAAGCARLSSKLEIDRPGLIGTDLVRLALERCRLAHQAVDLITDLIERHGQGVFPDCPAVVEGDSAFLVASPGEAFVLEAAGHHWVLQEPERVRAVSDVGTIRQDWARISRGLSSHVIGHGWWPADGSKIDPVDSVHASVMGTASALRRWGRATFLMEQQSGQIDVPFLRRLLADHYEGMQGAVDPFSSGDGPTPLCRHGSGPGGWITTASIVANLQGREALLPAAWCAFGPPCLTVFFPIYLDGDLPAAFTSSGHQPGVTSVCTRTLHLNEQLRRNPRRLPQVAEAFARLQERFDRDVEEFSGELATLRRQDPAADLQRQTSTFMQHTLERFDEVLGSMPRHEPQLIS